MCETNKNAFWKDAFVVLLYGVFWVLCISVSMFYQEKIEKNWFLYHKILFWAFIGILVKISFYIQVVLHEAGHLIFGILSGYRFVFFRCLSFVWIKEGNKIKFKYVNQMGTKGQCLMAPPDLKDGKMPFITYNLGGVITNFFCGSSMILISHFTSNYTLLKLYVTILGLSGILSAIINAVPMRMNDIDNDGYNVISLVYNPSEISCFWKLLKINELSIKGVRLRDMPEEWFVLPADIMMQNNMGALVGFFSCNRVLDKGEMLEATNRIDYVLKMASGISSFHRNHLMCDRIFLELVQEEKSEIFPILFTEEIQKFMFKLKNMPSILRTKYAVELLYNRNIEEAERVKERFNCVLESCFFENEVVGERELFNMVDLIKKEKYINNECK